MTEIGGYSVNAFDEDGELQIGTTWFSREDAAKLRDWLDEMLSDTKPSIESYSRNNNEIADALREVASAIREAAPKPLEPVVGFSPATTRIMGSLGSFESPNQCSGADMVPEPDRTLGEGEPQDGDDQDEWNTAAFALALANDTTVRFTYKKPFDASLYSMLPAEKTHGYVLPLRPVQVTGPSHDPYRAVLTRDYDSDNSYVMRTFRLDRIVGYVRLNDD